MTILVAEDDRDIAELIGRYLQKAGWTAHIVASGDDALVVRTPASRRPRHSRRHAARIERP